MSYYATNYIVDELTGDKKLIKHLNKCRIDRGTWNYTSGGWNKSGKKARIRGGNCNFYSCKSQRKIWINKILIKNNIL